MSGRLLTIAHALLLLTLGVACGRPYAPRDVIFITVDTLRADRLGFAGYWRDTSPAIDQIAREGAVFDNARSGAGWTLPAMASLFTGRRPRAHGARDFHSSIDRKIPTLPEILRQHGFETRGYVSNVLLDARYGFDRGFDHFDASLSNVGNPHQISTSEQLTNRVLADLDRRPVDEPLFLWVHYSDPHFAYVEYPGEPFFGPTPADRYDGEIARTDRAIGQLLDGLRGRSRYAHALIVLTADHGEEFGEHGGIHHETLHAEVVEVPLVIRAPGAERGRSSAPARQIDVAPTVLAQLDIPQPPAWPGRDLFARSADEQQKGFYERDVPTRFRQRAVRNGDYKLIVVESRPPDTIDEALPSPSLKPGMYLYDKARDPHEAHNLFAPDHPQLSPLLAALREHFDDPTLGVSVGAPAAFADAQGNP
jgi:choline-sulfatase